MSYVYSIEKQIYNKIVETIGTNRPEKGGLLGGSRMAQSISHYYFDLTAADTSATYSPNVENINKVIAEWQEQGVEMLGFIHSHPALLNQPSSGDDEYARSILQAMPSLKELFLPIVTFRRKSGSDEYIGTVNAYACSLSMLGGLVRRKVSLQVIEEGRVLQQGHELRFSTRMVDQNLVKQIFERVDKAYDLDRLRRSRIVAVGAGGAAEYLENLARTGIEEFVLIDPDVVSFSNIATQQTYLKDIGRTKISVIHERLLQINPNIQVLKRPCVLNELDDAAMEQLLFAPIARKLPPEVTLLCGLTDSFEAQGRVNRLALEFGVPSLCAQVYEKGAGCEVTFTHPSYTKACHRCALGSRYRAFEQGTLKSVGSQGCPIFTTNRLNALKGMVTMALLHADTGHAYWSSIIPSVASRNLVLVRTSPDIRKLLGLDVFERTFGTFNPNIYFDETIWTKVTPDSGMDGGFLCPDCGGIGDLKHAEGSFSDTITGEKKTEKLAIEEKSAIEESVASVMERRPVMVCKGLENEKQVVSERVSSIGQAEDPPQTVLPGTMRSSRMLSGLKGLIHSEMNRM